MISEYFDDLDVKKEFSQEFISLWSGWLGRDECYKLDEVSEAEWERFNQLVRLLHSEYEMYAVNLENETINKLEDLDKYLPTYAEDMDRGQMNFTTIIIPSLNAVLAETWDYTYVLYHKNNGAVESLKPLIKKSNLYSFSD
ncbi:hypothetical protein [Pseudoalteromonas phenolica]|uniref:Uncharacterized protein n=1 Tax=Pseudoalteromonas phenolica TaxID=161398 RepID=A0A0S2K2P4_9GAMM|nr:hypothetical protein [Pseudoalteromonas phenolica]ALO42775.1 hypothetical protein PP2015_2278 [Pseudoalteromonas phenolica]MBE0356094.1 hypothetical protein [Pseudoalteromonas phenolica O-BC30]